MLHCSGSPVTNTAKPSLTHGPYELLVQLERQQRVGQISEPLLEHASDDVDVVVVEIRAVDI